MSWVQTTLAGQTWEILHFASWLVLWFYFAEFEKKLKFFCLASENGFKDIEKIKTVTEFCEKLKKLFDDKILHALESSDLTKNIPKPITQYLMNI